MSDFESKPNSDSSDSFPAHDSTWKFYLPAIIIGTGIFIFIVSSISAVMYFCVGKRRGKASPVVDTNGTDSVGWMKDVEAHRGVSAIPGSHVSGEDAGNDVCSDGVVKVNTCDSVDMNTGGGNDINTRGDGDTAGAGEGNNVVGGND
ncbi:hypothetical protein Ocin01_14070 [Orchesella cincta]|uniref:Uncharacterized protein n=1 Tax=Orchesella cincta TaxID=48709 RepID=A0A1D2MI70_ORCCI|nr:hypothetical protein Ocin01_14070 [Orchesella cincta]